MTVLTLRAITWSSKNYKKGSFFGTCQLVRRCVMFFPIWNFLVYRNFFTPKAIEWFKITPSDWFQNLTPFDMWHLVKKWMWWGVWVLPGPPGQAKPVPVRATARGRSEASWEPWNHPIPPKKILLTKTIYGLKLLLLKFFCRTPPSRGYSSDFSDFYKFLLRDPLVGWVAQKIFSNKSFSPYMVLVSNFFSGV